MFVNKYKIMYSENKILKEVDRNEYMNAEFFRLNKDFCKEIKTEGKTALLYVGGPAMHHSDGRDVMGTSKKSTIAIKSQIGYNIFTVAKMFEHLDIDYISSNANTCASGMHCLYEAKMLFEQGFEDIIIYGTDLVEDTQLLLFKQLKIDVVCGDGSVVLHLSNKIRSTSIFEITDVKWKFNLDKSPMSVSYEGYKKLLESFNDLQYIDIVKVHGTGTSKNNEAEDKAVQEFGLKNIIEYKSKIGHTQGISSLLEMMMLYEDSNIEFGRALILASGMGGFYGGCIIKTL